MNVKYDIFYNGKSSLDYGLLVEHRPVIPSAMPNITEFNIPARDGPLHRSDGTVQNVEFPVEFAFYVKDEDKWLSMFRDVTSWLYDKTDTKLILSEDPDWYYDVTNVLVRETPSRVCWNGGRFKATFTVRGYAYHVEGIKEQPSNYNPYDICRPLYKLTGEANTTLTVNGNSVTINVGQGVTVDTDLMITYRTSNGTMQNTSMTGDYTKLWFKPGQNTVTATNGVTVKVFPRWRKRI